jgi:hypothetical protein
MNILHKYSKRDFYSIINYIGILMIIILYIFLTFSKSIPITYDEIWNFTNISSYGPNYVTTHYPFPNNHVLYSLYSSLSIPKSSVSHLLTVLRLPNVLIFLLFMYVLWRIFFITDKDKVFKILFILLATPYITLYLVLARGYMLGALACIAGIIFLINKRFMPASLIFALSVYTVPTFSYVIPGILMGSLIINGINKKTIIKNGLFCISIVFFSLLLYFPIIKFVIARSHSYNDYGISEFIKLTVLSLSNFNNTILAVIFFSLIITAVVSIFIASLSNKKNRQSQYIILFTTSIFGYILSVIILNALHLANPPFVRSGIIVPVFIYLIVMIGINVLNKKLRGFLMIIILINTLVGISNLLHYSISHNEIYLPSIKPLGPSQLSLLSPNEIRQYKCIEFMQWTELPMANYLSNIYQFPIVQTADGSHQCCSAVSKRLLNNSDSTITLCKMLNSDFSSEPTKSAPEANNTVGLITLEAINPSSYDFPKINITSDQPLYKVQKIERMLYESFLQIFILDPTISINTYLKWANLEFSDVAQLQRKGNYKAALKSAYKAENEMTKLVIKVQDLSNNGYIEPQLAREIISASKKQRLFITDCVNTAPVAEKVGFQQVLNYSTSNENTLLILINKLKPGPWRL